MLCYPFEHALVSCVYCILQSSISQIAPTDRGPVRASSILDGRVFATFYEVVILYEYLNLSLNLSGIHVI